MYTGGKTYALDTLRATTVFVHTASPLDVLTGVSASPVELTRYADKIKQSAQECTVSLSWHDELYGVSQPSAGQVLEIKTEGASYWIGIIQAISDYRLRSGEKSMTILARSRDATPAWRDVKRATDVYPTATPLAYIAKQIAQAIGLAPAEITLPDTGASTVQSNTQLADVSPWSMLTTLYQPGGLEPFVDCRGRLKCISRDITRPSDIVLSDNRRLIDVSGSKSKPALTEMSIRWLDPKLTEVAQQDRMLDRTAITAGFFQLHQKYEAHFSADKTQRARDTHMVIKQSANSGLLNFCTEKYVQDSTTSGQITLTTSLWAPALATTAMVAMLGSSYIPDGVSFGHTIPIGRIVHDVAEGAMMLTMMSMGTGQYEIWGTPFDYVHARNTTTAYNPAAKVWEIQPQEIENDFVLNEVQAQSFAIRELIYQARGAFSYNLTIVDDTRIEPADIIELSDGTRVYVTGYSRDLSSGAPALLTIQGFVATVNAVVGSTQVISPVYYPPTPRVNFVDDTPTPPTIPPGGGVGDPIIIPAIDVDSLHDHFELKIFRDRGNNPIYPQIDEWGTFGVDAISPVQIGSFGSTYFHYIDELGNVLQEKYIDQLGPTCTSTSSGHSVYCDPQFAFEHRGYWKAGLLPTTPERYHSLSVVTHSLIPMHGYTLETSDVNSMPRDWDFYVDGKLVQVVRELDAFQSGDPLRRVFSLNREGIRYYRLNIARSYLQYAAPLAPVWFTFIQSLEMLGAAGSGVDLCRTGGGFGDAEQSHSCAGGRAAFNGDGWESIQQNGMPPTGPQNWVRYRFPSERLVAAYAITAGELGVASWAPYDWTFEASVDGVNWTVVDTQTAVTFQPGERKEFALARRLESGVGAPETPIVAANNLLAQPQLSAQPVVGVPVSYVLVDGDGGQDEWQYWYLDGRPILGAMSLNYTPLPGDAGHLLSVSVGHQTPYSRSPGMVSEDVFVQAVAGQSDIPIFWSTTDLEYEPHVGVEVGYRPALLNCLGPVTVTRLWTSFTTTSTAATYTPSAYDVGHALTVVETAMNPYGTAVSVGRSMTVLA